MNSATVTEARLDTAVLGAEREREKYRAAHGLD